MEHAIGALWQRLRLALTLVLATALLTGCTSIRLVPAYDEQIDAGLTTLYGDTVAFVDRMVAAAGTPAGSYAQNSGFYDEAGARVEALIARAEAHRVLNDCPSTAIANRALSAARVPQDVRGAIGTLDKDDCQVQLLRLIKDGFNTMRQIHQIQADDGFPPSAKGQFIDGGVGAELRAAITVEIAKRATK